MAQSHLRVYYGPADEQRLAATDSAKQTVTLPLDEVAPLLAEAVHNRRTWLRDFKNDEITISTDLYEVLLAYQYFRRPSA
jgi:hypothetical protein